MIELQLQHQLGQLGLNISPPQYDIKITNPDLQIQQKPPEVNIDQPAAILETNGYPARASIGIYNLEDLLRNQIQEAKQKASDGRDRIVADGDTLSDLSRGVTIGQLVEQYYLNSPQKELTLSHIDSIQVKVQTAPVKIAVQPQAVVHNLNYGSVRGDLTLGTVKVYWDRPPKFEARAIGSLINTEV